MSQAPQLSPVNGLPGIFPPQSRYTSIGTAWNGFGAKPFLLVTPSGPNDGGDFGPYNSPTGTAGIVEAFGQGPAVLSPGDFFPINPIPLSFANYLKGAGFLSSRIHAPGPNTSIFTSNPNGFTFCVVEDLGIDTGGFSGVTGFNTPVVEASCQNIIRRIRTTGNFAVVGNFDGQEDTHLDHIWTTGSGDIYFHALGGATWIDWLVINAANEGVLHAGAQTLSVRSSVLNTVNFDSQYLLGGGAISPVTTFDALLDHVYMANPANSAGQHKFRSGDGQNLVNTVRSLELDTVYVGLKNGNAVFSNSNTTANWAIQRIKYKNFSLQILDASACSWVNNASAGTVNIGGGTLNLPDGSLPFDSATDTVNVGGGSLGPGATLNNGLATFTFPQVGVLGGNVTTPGVPATGVAQQNNFPMTMLIIILTATGATATITDFDQSGSHNTTASFPLVAGTIIPLPPFWKITPTYTTLTWKWLGKGTG